MSDRKQKVPTKKTVKRSPRGKSSESDLKITTGTTTKGGSDMTNAETISGETSAQDIGKAGSAVKEGVVSSLKGINEIEAEIVSLVRNTVSNTLRATGAVADEAVGITKDVVKGAIQATEEVGQHLR